MEDPNHAEICAVGRRRVGLRGDSHRRFHPHRCRHGIVISIPANAEKTFTMTLESLFTFVRNPRSRCAGNRVHHRPEYAI